MGETKRKLDNLSFMSVDKETDILDQLKCCQIYFQHFADPTFIENTSQFYDNLRVSMCHFNCNEITKLFYNCAFRTKTVCAIYDNFKEE